MFTSDQSTVDPDNLLRLQALRKDLYWVQRAAKYKGRDKECMEMYLEAAIEDMGEIWKELDSIIRSEEEKSLHVQEELRKFEQGFAYKGPIC